MSRLVSRAARGVPRGRHCGGCALSHTIRCWWRAALATFGVLSLQHMSPYLHIHNVQARISSTLLRRTRSSSTTSRSCWVGLPSAPPRPGLLDSLCLPSSILAAVLPAVSVKRVYCVQTMETDGRRRLQQTSRVRASTGDGFGLAG